MQRLKTVPFELERYFAKYEFTAKYLLCCSDCEAVSLKEILALADDECKDLWENMTLGYATTPGQWHLISFHCLLSMIDYFPVLV